MNTSAKVLIGVVMVGVLYPSVTFAAWWNPISWFKRPVASQSVATTTVRTDQERIKALEEELFRLKEEKIKDVIATTSIATTTKKENSSKVVQAIKPVIKQVPTQVKPLNNNVIQNTNSFMCNGQSYSCPAGQTLYCSTNIAQCHDASALFCNGQYWTACPIGSGQQFSCPAQGNPTCLIPSHQNNSSKINVSSDNISLSIEKCKAQAQKMKDTFLDLASIMKNKIIDEARSKIQKQIDIKTIVYNALLGKPVTSAEMAQLDSGAQSIVNSGDSSQLQLYISVLNRQIEQDTNKLNAPTMGKIEANNMIDTQAQKAYTDEYQKCLAII